MWTFGIYIVISIEQTLEEGLPFHFQSLETALAALQAFLFKLGICQKLLTGLKDSQVQISKSSPIFVRNYLPGCGLVVTMLHSLLPEWYLWILS